MSFHRWGPVRPIGIVALSLSLAISGSGAGRPVIAQGDPGLVPDAKARLVSPRRGFPSLSPVAGNTAPGPTSDRVAASQSPIIAAPAITVTSSLAIVLGLLAAIVWVSRKYGGGRLGGSLPSGFCEPLGSTMIDTKTKVTLLRVGSRVIVTAQSGGAITPLTEITAADEVRALVAGCHGKSKQDFRTTLASIERESAPRGFAGEPVRGRA